MMTFAVTLKGELDEVEKTVTVDAENALQAIRLAKAGNSTFQEVSRCELIEAR